MKAIIDGQLYHVDLTKIIDFARLIYIKLNNEGVVTKDGVIKIGDHSLVRTALKMVMTPLVIPWIEKMYAEKNIVLDKPEKHCDLIDYAINAYFDYLVIVEGQTYVNIASKTNDDSSKTIIAVTPVREERTLAISETATPGKEPCNQ